ncbi:hypothetical protein IV79_GL001509 [Pediococcus claussenii]|nr:hypothetical protein IV79_GL001509 [Pediococcus claussenii]
MSILRKRFYEGGKMSLLIGLGAIGIGLWQIRAAYKSFNGYKESGSKNANPFMLYAIWFGAFIGIIFLLLGVMALRGGF